jgi:hypothetical protein
LTLAIIAVCFLKEVISKLPVTIIKSLDIDNDSIGAYKTISTSYELKAKQDTANIAKE